ncbi:olfactory receptor 51G2-like [Ambystoma mexicanum]|uniref:olfactory receptor 51G2-like n=1 Tax=Ambystoma mexicanum TaxID=8296 RepID=UPI0037E83843
MDLKSSMSVTDSRNASLPSFLLMGSIGTDLSKTWIALLPFVLYFLSIFGNGLILFIVKTERQFWEPMYLFLAMLAATDLCMNLTTLPTVLSVLWFDYRNMNFYACLTQLFIIHSLSLMGSGVLVAMSFDRYLAICYPLRYASILHPLITKIGLASLIRSFCIMFPLPFLLNRLPYCNNIKLYHAFCYHPDVMNLACADITINSTYGLVLVFCTFSMDSLLILLSYVMILKTVVSIVSKEEGGKTLRTCVSHICSVLVFYVSLISLSFTHRYGMNGSPLLPLLMGLAHTLIPSALNPLIYSMNTKPIQKAIRKHVWGDTTKKAKVKHFAQGQNILAIGSLAFEN